MSKLVYSDYLGTMICKGFTTRKVIFNKQGSEPYKICNPFHWTWNEDDLLYYRDDVDDTSYCEIPKNGVKTYTLKKGCKARILVTLD